MRIVGVVAVISLDGVFPGSLIQFSATVQNYGDANSDATTLRYYRSTDATISVSDTEVGTGEVSALVASGQVSEGIHLTAPSTAGTYYYGACVDAVAGESDTTNNCSTSVQVRVQETPPPEQGNPDLAFQAVAVGHGPSEEGYSVQFVIVIQNVGDGASAASRLRYFRSTDATITTSDTEVGTDAVPGLAVAGASLHTLEKLPSPGTYYYGVCVDAVAGEFDTSNNCSSGAEVVVPAPAPVQGEGNPDLIID